jgi:hypothetical protein
MAAAGDKRALAPRMERQWQNRKQWDSAVDEMSDDDGN